MRCCRPTNESTPTADVIDQSYLGCSSCLQIAVTEVYEKRELSINIDTYEDRSAET